jgi:hypothetical protein
MFYLGTSLIVAALSDEAVTVSRDGLIHEHDISISP